MGNGGGPQTRRMATLNVVASPRASVHGASLNRSRRKQVGVDAGTSQSTPSCLPRQTPPVPRFEASVDASKATGRSYDPARKLANRQALRDYHEQVRKGVASGEEIVVPLTTNASGIVILLRSKWQGAIRALAQNYLKWSERDFDEHVPELIASIDDKIRKKMFS